ncbi:uncharacterized protein G2W53_014313 [Senna tora]|uniref:Uncharacterized protein n=1 Tax=Senna tora TaxID=362788 RepID=A0A834WTA6_9FABA|nr:uncharacterized protein G2W53_014313 [Senna tora]
MTLCPKLDLVVVGGIAFDLVDSLLGINKSKHFAGTVLGTLTGSESRPAKVIDCDEM